jgi:hypothetical protein
MRLTFSLKNLSLGLAVVSMISAGAASAQSLAGVNTRLVKPLDSQTAANGQEITVKLDNGVTTPAGVKLPRGTELIGKIADVKASQNGGPASVSVVFTTAQLKGGKQIPVKATVVGAFPAISADEAQNVSPELPPDHVGSDRSIDQEPGELPGITLKAAVQDPNSGTFTKANGNFTLNAGTFLQVAVAPSSSSTSTSAAE